LISSLIADQADELISAIDANFFYDGFSLCTDDVHIHDLLSNGHINYILQLLTEYDIPTPAAIKIAALNSWLEYGVQNAGAIAPGYIADLQLVKGSDYWGQPPTDVFVNGQIIVADGCLQATPPPPPESLSFEKKNSILLKEVRPEDFVVQAPPDHHSSTITVTTIDYPDQEGEVLTTFGTQSLAVSPVSGALILPPNDDDLCWIKVFNRYGLETVGTGLIRGFPLHKEEALATSISHDSHNVVVLYKKDTTTAAQAVNSLREAGGGIAYVNDQGQLYLHALPVGGLMATSDTDPQELADSFDDLSEAYQNHNGVFAQVTAAFILALPVAPFARMSDLGIVDTEGKKIIPLFPDQSQSV
jgi:adenine deaminase